MSNDADALKENLIRQRVRTNFMSPKTVKAITQYSPVISQTPKKSAT